MLIASFGLLVSRRGRAQTDGAVKYVAINLVATTALLVGIGLLYGLTGTLNLADLHAKAGRIEAGPVKDAVAVLLVFAFAVKAALFPLFFWLPASYHTTVGVDLGDLLGPAHEGGRLRADPDPDARVPVVAGRCHHPASRASPCSRW